MGKTRIVILGGGPAGLGAAYQLARRGDVEAVLLEQSDRLGGNAGSFELAGIRCDYGSHRLHPASDPRVLDDIRQLLGGDLVKRPRHGRIRLQGRWIHFPLKATDLFGKLPPAFGVGVATDIVRKLIPSRNGSASKESTFSSVLEKGLGRTICRDFYFPYAIKLWGLPPDDLSAKQAERRVSNNSLGKMIGKVFSSISRGNGVDKSIFYYPRKGFGQISEAYAAAAEAAGARIIRKARVERVDCSQRDRIVVGYSLDGVTATVEADYVWSTIPITILARLTSPQPPEDVLRAASTLDYRAMLLIYLVLDQEQFTEYDAHYFPETQIPISRLSEPKNYAANGEPKGKTVLCAELPCAVDDKFWKMTDEELGAVVRQSLSDAGIPVRGPVSQVVTRRLRQAYPIYRRGYETAFDGLDAWVGQMDRILTFGRQGLFAHDNTHHALFMAYAAAECVESNGGFDQQKWEDYRRVFETHVVED
ncbi:MAG TPA: FAD-dependent oxidoreductase [Rhodothermales bacterium]